MRLERPPARLRNRGRYVLGTRLAALAALGIAAGISIPAFAEKASARADRVHALERLKSVPVFYIAGPGGRAVDDASLYLTRAQASLAIGMMRGELASAGRNPDGLQVVATDLAAITADPAADSFVKPMSTIDAAVNLDGVPLFVIRDKDGSPFTLTDKRGAKKIYFYLSEDDARTFIDRVINETGRTWDDIRLSVISLDVVVNSMMTSKDPTVRNWVIYPSAETRNDAASLKAAMLDPQKQP
jgi:hypothetical protein